MKNLSIIQCFFQNVLLGMMGLLICSCTQNKEQQAIAKETTKIIPPRVTILANLPDSSKPKVTILAEMPKPTIKLTSKPGKIRSFIDSLSGLPQASEVQGNGFFTTYTTENGLTADVVSCGITDKEGALWFGTFGSGVSKYDGKKFTTFATAQGLANDVVRSILEDSKGNIWFGTNGGGLSRYDGKSFTTYTTAQGLADNSIIDIIEDKKGNLWISSIGSGISRFDGKRFTRYTTAQGLAHNGVWKIIEDKKGNLWFSTDGGGVSKYDGKGFTTYTTAQGLASNDVFSILEDSKGNIWFGTMGSGLSRYDGNTFTTYTTSQGLADNRIISCLEDKAGDLWFGTLGGGISKYDSQSFTTYTTKQGLANNDVSSIIEDKVGNLWFGTLGGGVSKYEGKHLMSFTTAHGLGTNIVSSITEDKKGNLWFGAIYGGISKYDGKSLATFTIDQGLANDNVLRSITDKAGNLWFGTDGAGVSKYDGQSFTTYTTAQGLANNHVSSIIEDKAGNLWFGTLGGGVSKFDGKSFATYTTKQGLASDRVSSISEDKAGNLWFGTFDGGVSKYDGQSFTTYTTAQGLADRFVSHVQEDSKGNLWFATDRGLSVIPSERVRQEKNKSAKNKSLNKPLFTTFTTQDGLPNNTIISVFEDREGRLIIGTDLGIAVLNKGIRSFDIEGGIELYNSATGYLMKTTFILFIDSKGILWVGSGSDKTGLIRFDYKAVPKTKHTPVLVLQNVKINNEILSWHSLLPSSKSKQPVKGSDILTTPASITEEVTAFGRRLLDSEQDNMRGKFSDIQFDGIAPWYPIPQHLVLPYRHNSISFEFNAIETSRNFMVKYQYMLEGYDVDWSSLSYNTSAIFGNMYEGNYTLKVKAISPEGVWTKPITYTFTVLPPPWRSPWAYLLYGLVVMGLLVVGRQAIIRNERKKADQRLRLLQAEQLHQIDQLKSRFFTNISHEFRTPLTLIFAPLEKLLAEQLDTQVKKNLRLIDRHARQLLHLINQLMDFSKLESGSLKLSLTHGNVNQQVKVLTFSFFSLAESKGIHLAFSSAYQSIDAHFDSNVLEKVMHNLLSNAFKFTPSGGSVTVTVSLSKALEEAIKNTSFQPGQWLRIHVKDTGIGIPAEEQNRIFDRFYQVDGSQIREGEGTGIGLALAKELVELHGGRIKVTSKVGEGSEFSVYLPLTDCKAQLNPSVDGQEMMLDRLIMIKQENKMENLSYEQTASEEIEANESLPLLLVVEDNREVREFIRDSFRDNFRVIEAFNGLEGLEMGRQHIPDLIITDRMMPKMDGIELCRQLKTDALTSHIPVIMLTAKASQESKIEGLEIGADDYVAKPFSLQELKARVKNLIEQRKKLRERFTKEVKLQAKDIAITSTDELFINKAIAIVEKHMSDEDFTVEIMVEEIAMSRVQLHRKLKALTDQSTSEFIRTIRLKRAASLLEQGYGNISEVMYGVGFSNVSYFANCFKKMYGVNPSDYTSTTSTQTKEAISSEKK